MTSFLQTTNLQTGAVRYYIGGCRVTRGAFHSTGDGRKECFSTVYTATQLQQRHERRL